MAANQEITPEDADYDGEDNIAFEEDEDPETATGQGGDAEDGKEESKSKGGDAEDGNEESKSKSKGKEKADPAVTTFVVRIPYLAPKEGLLGQQGVELTRPCDMCVARCNLLIDQFNSHMIMIIMICCLAWCSRMPARPTALPTRSNAL